jgi:DNA-directed RNA polymerase subunit M/transcription elongation factor TFIIS
MSKRSVATLKGIKAPPPPLHDKLNLEGRWKTVHLLESLRPSQDSVQLERHLFVQCQGDVSLYEAAVYRVCAAIHYKRDIVSEWEPEKLVAADLSHPEQSVNKEVPTSQQPVLIPKTVECQIKCGRCKSTQVSVEQKQTRGADESMTVFVQCDKCGLRWKM